MGKLQEKMAKKALILCLTGSLAGALTGCGSSSGAYDAVTHFAAEMPAENYAMSAEEMGGGYLSEETADAGAYDMADGKTEEVGDEAANSGSERKLIRTVNLSVETREFDQVMDTLEKQVEALGGYIENMDTYNGSSYSGYRSSRNSSMTIRIPREQLDGFLNTVSEISNVVSRSENVEDVTLSYVDLESHRDALRTEQARLLELLERAESIEDIITIEERLSNVRYQLESMESQLRTYDNKVDYSTVYLNISEVQELTPIVEETTWERISGGFLESLKDIGNGLKEFCIRFIIHIPYIVVWVVIIAVIVIVIRLLHRRKSRNRQKKATPVQQEGTPAQQEKK